MLIISIFSVSYVAVFTVVVVPDTFKLAVVNVPEIVISDGNLALSMVPLAIFVAFNAVILAPEPSKLVTEIALGNLALSMVPLEILVALINCILEPAPS